VLSVTQEVNSFNYFPLQVWQFTLDSSLVAATKTFKVTYQPMVSATTNPEYFDFEFDLRIYKGTECAPWRTFESEVEGKVAYDGGSVEVATPDDTTSF